VEFGDRGDEGDGVEECMLLGSSSSFWVVIVAIFNISFFLPFVGFLVFIAFGLRISLHPVLWFSSLSFLFSPFFWFSGLFFFSFLMFSPVCIISHSLNDISKLSLVILYKPRSK
jgi:hypothetical protein